MSAQLVRPGALDQALRSGLFLSGVRRTGKTTFLRQDLIPALEADGAIVIYVDLWSDTSVSPSALLHRAVRAKLAELQDPLSAAFSVLKKVVSAEVAAHGFKFKFDLSKLGEQGGPTLAEAFTEVVEQAGADLVLIVDEVQQTLASEDGLSMMLALKAARDAINLSPNLPGHFLFIGTGSNRALVQELLARRNMAFQGAQSLPYPLLGDDFVSHLLTRLRLPGSKTAPRMPRQPRPSKIWAPALRSCSALFGCSHIPGPQARTRTTPWNHRGNDAGRDLPTRSWCAFRILARSRRSYSSASLQARRLKRAECIPPRRWRITPRKSDACAPRKSKTW